MFKRRSESFYHPSKKGLGPFFLLFTEGFRSLNGSKQILGGEWGGGGGGEECHLAPTLLKLLEFNFHFRSNFIFGWQGWQHGPLALVGKILYTRSCHFFFVSLAASGFIYLIIY